MKRYIISRLLQAIALVIGVLFIVFIMLHLTGDPASLMVSRNASPEDIEKIRHEFGFDKPIIVQFANFLKGAFIGDFGMSLRYRQPAMKLIIERLPATIQLATAALLFSLIIGIPIGLLGGSNPNTGLDLVARTTGLIGQTIPSFWLALMLIVVFAVKLRWFPTFGRETVKLLGINFPTKSIVLPAFALSLFTTGQLARFTRSSVLEIKNEDYIRTAYSKGLPRRIIYVRHILKNAAIPIISIVGVQFSYLLSGSIYIETIFSWPGLGQLLAEAVFTRDFGLVQATAFFTSVVVVVLHLLTDIAYGLADPRIKYR